MIVVPDPLTFVASVTAIVSIIELSLVFLIIIFPLSTSTISEKVSTIFAVVETPVALSDGVLEESLGTVITEKLKTAALLMPAKEVASSDALKAVAAINT